MLDMPLLVVKLHRSEPLFVQCFLSNNPNKDYYALDSRPHDNALCLVILIRGINSKGKVFQCYGSCI